jgi:hypothetical protein
VRGRDHHCASRASSTRTTLTPRSGAYLNQLRREAVTFEVNGDTRVHETDEYVLYEGGDNARSVAIYFVHYNFERILTTLALYASNGRLPSSLGQGAC